MKDLRTPDKAVERVTDVEIEISEELNLAQEDGTTVVLEAGDKVKVLREERTPNGWGYDPRDQGMSGYPTLYNDGVTIAYAPEDRVFQVMHDGEMEYMDYNSANDLLNGMKGMRSNLSAEDLIYFL